MEQALPTCPSSFFRLAIVLLGIVVGAGAWAEESEPEAVDESDTRLVFVEQHRDSSAGGSVPRLQAPYDVTVSPDGKHVYLASQFDHAITCFVRDQASGALLLRGDVSSDALGEPALNGARSIALNPDGRFLYSVSMFGEGAPSGGSLATFGRDSASGDLSFLSAVYDRDAGIDGLSGARSVAVAPDGRHLYVAAHGDSMVSVFRLHATSGAASFVGVYEEGDQGVEELSEPHDIAVAPDGRHVYVALLSNEVITFERDPDTGLLDYLGRTPYLQGIDTGPTVRAIELSPDGKQVYLTSWNSNALTAFARDPTSGALSHLADYRHGVGEVKGLSGPYALSVSPDGRYVYVAAFASDAVTSFRRDDTSGALVYHQSVSASAGEDWIINGPMSIATSPDGLLVYLGSGAAPHALSAFRRELVIDPPRFVVQPIDRSVEEGEAAAFHALAQGSEISYQWSRDGAPLVGETLAVLSLAAVSSSDDGSVFQVAASNAGGSVTSEAVSLSVLPPISVAAPQDLTALEITSSSARLSWRDSSENETAFEIQRRVSGEPFATVGVVWAGVTTYLDSGLNASTAYRYRVAAKRNDTYSAWSNDAVIESYDDIPQPPVDLQVISQAYNRTTIGWKDRSAVEDGFEVYRRRSEMGAGWELVALTDKDADRYVDSSVSPSSTYAYRVRAFNESGKSEYSNAVVALTEAIPVSSLLPSSRSLAADDVSEYAVAVSSGKEWEATSLAAWLQITSPKEGRGAGNQTVFYRATPNESQESRVGTIVIGGMAHTVTQAGSLPFLRLSTTELEVGSEASVVTVEVASNVAWLVAEDADWLSIEAGVEGDGYGSIRLLVEANSQLRDRETRIRVNEVELALVQRGVAARLALGADQARLPGSGGFGEIPILANVSWEAIVDADWVQLPGQREGEGDATVIFEVAANPLRELRMAKVRINDQIFTVAQEPSAAAVSSLPKPVFTSADASGGLGVELVWEDRSEGEIGFLLRRAIAGTDRFVDVVTLEPNATSYFDRRAPRGATLYYRIAALDTVGQSEEDAIVTEPLPASSIRSLVAQVALEGSRSLTAVALGVEGEGRYVHDAQGRGPELGRQAMGQSVLMERLAESAAATRRGFADPIDWSAAFEVKAASLEKLPWNGEKEARGESLAVGIRSEWGSAVFVRSALATGFVGRPGAEGIALFWEVEGSVALPLLIKGSAFGAGSQGLADAEVELLALDAEGDLESLARNADWRDWMGAARLGLESAMQAAGLPPFEEGEAAALILIDVPPGRYVATLRSASGSAGWAKLTVYDLR